MRYCFDIDGTICTTDCHYNDAVPYQEAIDWINKKYDEGHEITLFTSRGTLSETDWFDFTLNQIEGWGVKYHKLKLGKPAYDLFVDDRAISNTEWYNKEGIKI
tara:strand:+ start:1174 stop:1482 length:309 start_codon:yes stop_codon:yes gene_type:complete